MKFKVFLINLDISEQRLSLCEKEFEKFNVEYERVPGVYGKDLSEQEIKNCYDELGNTHKYKKSLSLGEIGCYLSHKKCWQKIVDEALDFAIILEDDFILSDSFNDFKMIFPKLKNWDFIRLAFSSRNVAISDRAAITEQYDLVYYRKVPINTLAQAVSLQGAKKLLNNSKKISRPIDVDIKHYWEKEVTVQAIDPPLIVGRQESESIITSISEGGGRDSKISFTRNLSYVIRYKINAFYYNKLKPKLEGFLS